MMGSGGLDRRDGQFIYPSLTCLVKELDQLITLSLETNPFCQWSSPLRGECPHRVGGAE